MADDRPEEITQPDAPFVDPSKQAIKPKKTKFQRFLLALLIVLAVGGFVLAGFYVGSHRNQPSDTQKMQGTVAMSERDLRDVVKARNLVVYWTGPVVGDKYTLFIPKTGAAVVRYLPAGASITDTSATFRLVATYLQKDAFALASAAISDPANLGFINIDGNAAYYVKTRPTNVLVGIKGKDIQIEIFDPGSGQAVALALFKGQIQQIK